MFKCTPETGELFWKTTLGGVSLGERAGFLRPDGYAAVRFGGRVYLVHRIVFAMAHGRWPERLIDHINCNKSDNKITNLREVSVTENNWNRPKQRNNTSGYKCVSFHKATKKWNARITVNGKQKSLGVFASAEEAHEAYCKAGRDLHGEYFNGN